MEQRGRFLNTKELAEFLGVSTGTIYSWVNQKKIKYHKFGRLVKFDLKEIDQWIRENVVEVRE